MCAWRRLGRTGWVSPARTANALRVLVRTAVATHPFHDKAVKWMGHPTPARRATPTRRANALRVLVRTAVATHPFHDKSVKWMGHPAPARRAKALRVVVRAFGGACSG